MLHHGKNLLLGKKQMFFAENSSISSKLNEKDREGDLGKRKNAFRIKRPESFG
jgi:hypothetical protein